MQLDRYVSLEPFRAPSYLKTIKGAVACPSLLEAFLRRPYNWTDMCPWSRCMLPLFSKTIKGADMCPSTSFDIKGADSLGRKHLKPFFLRLGTDFHSWPRRILHHLQISIVLTFCLLWRKIIHCLDCYPWRLAPVFDPQSRQRSAQPHCSAFMTCLRIHVATILALPEGFEQLVQRRLIWRTQRLCTF